MDHVTTRTFPSRKRIAIVSHDRLKPIMIDWVSRHQEVLKNHDLYATGTTGLHVQRAVPQLKLTSLMSGPLGGDQQLGAMIAKKELHAVIFFWDPLSAAAHDPDVKALLRIASVWNVPIATNTATADFIVSSPLLHSSTHPFAVPDYEAYLKSRAHL